MITHGFYLLMDIPPYVYIYISIHIQIYIRTGMDKGTFLDCPFYEVSSKTGEHVDLVFEALVRKTIADIKNEEILDQVSIYLEDIYTFTYQ